MGEGFDGFDEAAWFIAAGCHGQGYGFEAASAAHDWYGSRTARQRTVCMIDPGNTPSINLAEKLGYKVFREGSYKDNPVIMFERLAGRS